MAGTPVQLPAGSESQERRKAIASMDGADAMPKHRCTTLKAEFQPPGPDVVRLSVITYSTAAKQQQQHFLNSKDWYQSSKIHWRWKLGL